MFWYRSHSHRHHPLRRRAATALLALVALVLWAATAAPVQAQPPPGGLVSFTYTGAAQTWTVPPGVTRATFHVSGARGGDSFNGQGGFGRQATPTLMVTPGDTITIVVGGRGGNFSCSPPAMGGAGGFNGGGAGGRGGFCSGAGGGGASDVRIGGTTLDKRVLVAGGGGGGALNNCHGGDGGNPTGVQGGCAGGGSGGNQDGTSGSGQLGQGSAGTDSNGMAFPGNGGGGGGYYGGAGGTALSNPMAAAAGGGGSSFGPAGTSFAGRRRGDGLVIIVYRTPPSVTSISPTSGPEVGGTPVTLTGTGFQTTPDSTSVAFGSNVATGVSCSSATTCTATSPAGSGTVAVTVTTPRGTSNGVPYTYTTPPPPPAAPTVTNVSPSSGPTEGGTVVTISGSGFDPAPGATSVRFGSSAATGVSCSSATTCTATSPAGSGTVDVTVTTPSGTSNGVPYTYIAPPPPPPTAPTVTGISPASGPTTGGTVVSINGTGFALGQTIVTFGANPAADVSCASATSCTAISPPGQGLVDVRVTVGGRSSPATPADAFTYVPAPPPPSPSPSPPPPQPMTLTVQVWRILPPLVSEAQIQQTVTPVPGRLVQALVGSTVCAQGVTDSQGRVQLTVAADPPARGCGREGVLVTFRVHGQAAQGSVAFVTGGSTAVTLQLR